MTNVILSGKSLRVNGRGRKERDGKFRAISAKKPKIDRRAISGNIDKNQIQVQNRLWGGYGADGKLPGGGAGGIWKPPPEFTEFPTLPPDPRKKFTYSWADLCPPWPRCNVYPKCCQRSGNVAALRHPPACIRNNKDTCFADEYDDDEYF
ncbi:uncharacterized protein LOC26514339 [Drosophila ananassae]|uniref:uncharacterized protein LOC26514339 n=1 Tax=Drosophila ananassae TaxID=7217 RepID=UPI0013A5CBB8|nr:uncharacterized protein LOC26514339 [Drosophila ananassae]